MATTISVDDFRNSLLFVLDETFDTVHGAYLDRGTSLFETLDTISADEASRKIGPSCSCIAAHVNHVIFYFDVVFQYMAGENPGPQDWDVSWRLTSVTDAEWDELKTQLRSRQQQLVQLINSREDFDEDAIGGAFAVVAHTAYHLGEIRQATCILRQ